MTDRGGASQDPPEADVEDLQRRSKSMPHRKDSTDSEAGRQVGFDGWLSSAGALSGAQGKLFKHASEAGDVLLKIFDDDSFQVYNRNEDTEAIVEACILHTSIRMARKFLGSREMVQPCDEQTTEQFGKVAGGDEDPEQGDKAARLSRVETVRHMEIKRRKWHTVFSLKLSKGEQGNDQGQELVGEQPAIFELVSISGDKSGLLISKFTEKERNDPAEQLSDETRQRLAEVLKTNCEDQVQLDEEDKAHAEMMAECESITWEHVLLHGRGRLGETVLHLCFLAAGRPAAGRPEFRKLIHYLLDKYSESKVWQRVPPQERLRRDAEGSPDTTVADELSVRAGEKPLLVDFEKVPFVDVAYTAQPYYGEVALHMACANKDLDLVKLLVDHGASVVTPHSAGKFFMTNPSIYHGGSVLGVAVGLGAGDVVDFLLGHLTGSEKQANRGKKYVGPEVGTTRSTLRKKNTVPIVLEKNETPDWQEQSKDLGLLTYAEPDFTWNREKEQYDKVPGRKVTTAKQEYLSKQLQGNTVLHCAVAHGQVDMVKKLVEWGGNMYAQNLKKLNVLDYACLVGNLEMVEACARLCSQLVWEWGPIKCHQYELDKFFRAATLICSQGRGELVQLAQFKRLFQDRWESYAQVIFYAYFILHLVTCCMLTFLMPWFPVVASTGAQDEGLWAVHTVLYLFLGLFSCPYTAFEDAVRMVLEPRTPGAADHARLSGSLITAAQYIVYKMRVLRLAKSEWKSGRRWRLHFNNHPHLMVNMILSWLMTGFLWGAFIMHFVIHAENGVGGGDAREHRDVHRMHAAAGIASFFAWLRCPNYLRITKLFGPFVISVGEVFYDFFIKWFPMMFFWLMAFTCVLASILRTGFDDWNSFILALFTAAIGEPDFEFFGNVENVDYHVYSTAIAYAVYTLMMSLLLINLLIAMMSESYEEVQGKAQEKYSLAWGRGILAFTIIPGPKQLLRALSLSRGRRRPHHHVQVHMGDKVRWMMMLEELNEAPIGPSDDKEKSAKKKLARVEEGQRHLDKKMGAVEKKLEIIHEAVKKLAPK